LRRAREIAGHKDTRISGGAETIHQYLSAGHVNEIWIHLAPVLLGRGVRLFDGVDKSRFSIEIVEAIHSPLVTHVRYEVKSK
jgi:dihydrofolate reductase